MEMNEDLKQAFIKIVEAQKTIIIYLESLRTVVAELASEAETKKKEEESNGYDPKH